MWSGYEIVNWTVNEWKVTNGREGKGKQNLGLMASSRSSLFVHSLTSVTFIPLTSGPWSTLFLRSFPIVHPPLGFASSPRSVTMVHLVLLRERNEVRPSESRVENHVRSSHQPNGITARVKRSWHLAYDWWTITTYVAGPMELTPSRLVLTMRIDSCYWTGYYCAAINDWLNH